MAYMNQEKKKALAPKIKRVLKKYGMKATLGVRHHSTLLVNIKSGLLDIIQNFEDGIDFNDPDVRYIQGRTDLTINTYHIESHYTGKVKEFLLELIDAMNNSEDGSAINHNKSDMITDYFNVGWYIDINVVR